MPIDYQDDFKNSLKYAKKRTTDSLFDLCRCLVQCVHVAMRFSIVFEMSSVIACR